MKGFANFCKQALMYDMQLEAFNTEKIAAHEVENAYWSPGLDEPSDYYSYYFSLPSDPIKQCSGKPCYHLTLGGRGYDDLIYNVAFAHEYSSFGDRYERNQAIKQRTGIDPSTEMMNSVLHGLYEFVTKKNPKGLNWSAVSKSRQDAINPNARGKVYQLWAIKNLMGKYVPLNDQEWIRADAYQREYVEREGYPPWSEKYKGKKGYEMFMQAMQDFWHERESARERAERQHQEEETARLQRYIANPRQNPQGIQIGDEVYIKDQRQAHFKFKVIGMQALDDYEDETGNATYILSAHLLRQENGRYRDYDYPGDSDRFERVNKLYKATPENTRERDTRLAAAMVANYTQHYGISVGSEVMAEPQGVPEFRGVVREIKFMQRERGINIVVHNPATNREYDLPDYRVTPIRTTQYRTPPSGPEWEPRPQEPDDTPW